ncbi:hypothetical protein CTT31_06455 [Pseudoalteromonas maricaloris]|uniref:hypothetical protein n=1 Tax=Pseudoalteromonas maricaloris TaxID=184924 RepID=UPI0021AD9C64|nr:hypothetical protein [Pseudoalteromonas flavipulchra]USE68781.1 hypothetical protein CTT31_06455 [Pseudoalteromonas flavipulchra]
MQLSNSDIRTLRVLCWCLATGIPILLTGLIYITVGNSIFEVSESRLVAITTITSTYGFTMTGFVAAIGAYLLSLGSKVSFNFWKNGGNLKVFFHLYAAALFLLFACFISSLLLLAVFNNALLYVAMWSALITSILYLAALVFVAIKQTL